jgi:hypothetical protein
MSGKARAQRPDARDAAADRITIARGAVSEFEAALLDDLGWLGFVADGALTRQSERSAVYERVLHDLRKRGLTYACECSRADVASSHYPGTCRDKKLVDSPGLSVRVGWIHR